MRFSKFCFCSLVVSSVCVANIVAAEPLEEIIIKSHLLSEDGAAQSLRVLSGDELDEKIKGSLGETVAGEPGIRSASFGAAVGRPVIHGLGGARVKITEDRIDSLDVSVGSGDHAVTVEPFIANQITILKGASTLLYGSAAIGGVVDVETGRIAKQVPDRPLAGKLELRAGDNADTKTGVLRLDGVLNENLIWHVDAFSKRADDYEIPGFVESAFQRASEEHEEEEHDEHEEEGHEEHEEEEARDILAGSSLDSSGGALGLSYVGESGFIGFSISDLDSQYGLVGGHHHHEEDEGDEEHEEEGHVDEELPGMIDMTQTRFDFEAQLDEPFSGFSAINLRLGVNDYQHKEIEGNGELGTLFENNAWEGRVELSHYAVADFKGTLGVQFSDREYSALGEEAFVRPVDSKTQSIFWVGEREFDGFDIETGFRFENVKHDSSQVQFDELSFSTSSASIGVVIPASDAVTLSALLDYSSRAPSIEELFSNGPHLATQSFEVGDAGLQEEAVLALSLAFNYQSDLFDANVTLYRMGFDDFIYQEATGEIEDELPVFLYKQNDATFTGLDIEAGVHLFNAGGGDLDFTVMFDTVDAELDVSENQNLPRIPASRYGLGLRWSGSMWSAKLNFLRVEDQNDIANFELPTEAYNDLSVRISRKFEIGTSQINLFLHGHNLGDDEQRHHASFVKDLAPAPGRRVELGLRYQF